MDAVASSDFTSWVRLRSPSLRRYAFLLTGDGSGADDLLQDTLVKVYLSWHRIQDPSARDAYARVVMTRANISTWRRVGRRETAVEAVPDEGRVARDTSDRDAMWDALRVLGPRQRATVVLRFYEQLSEREIADVLGCSVGTVKSQLHRGLARLATLVPRSDWEEAR